MLSTAPAGAVLLSRHADRLDYRFLKRGDNWQAQAERPWDCPLTPEGYEQGFAMGTAAAAHCRRLGLPPVTRIITSPMLRCGQTATAAAEAIGVTSLVVEPGLAETMCEQWYRSWGVPGADSTWGGPKSGGFGMGTAVEVIPYPCPRSTSC